MELIPAKTIITKNRDTSWFGSDYNMNLYRGCSHGCIYCDSRSSCYRVDDFEQIKAKENALQIVRDDLRRKVKKGVVGTGAMSCLLYTSPARSTVHIDMVQYNPTITFDGELIVKDGKMVCLGEE